MNKKMIVDFTWYTLELKREIGGSNCLYRIASLSDKNTLEIDFMICPKNDDRDIVDVNLTVLNVDEKKEEFDKILSTSLHYIGKYKFRSICPILIDFDLAMVPKLDMEKEATILPLGFFCLNINSLHKEVTKKLVLELKHQSSWNLNRINNMITDINNSNSKRISTENTIEIEKIKKQLIEGCIDVYSYTKDKTKLAQLSTKLTKK